MWIYNTDQRPVNTQILTGQQTTRLASKMMQGYNHNQINIEKGKLLDHESEKAVINGFGTTPGTKPTTNSERKINNLITILQTNPQEISGEFGFSFSAVAQLSISLSP